ncbi:MAG: type II secretion system F family protein [Dehalococcoidia bacterium]
MAINMDAPPQTKPVNFRYVAIDPQGREVRGTVKAVTDLAAQQMLAERGFRTMSLDVAPSALAPEQLFPTLFQVKPRDIIVFSRQLATLLQSGLTLLPALELLQGQAAGSRQFRRVVARIMNDLRTGYAFSEAVARHPQVFSDIYIRTIGVGERTGRLEEVLRQMADYQEKQGAIVKKLKGALTYPAIIMVVGIVVGIILTQVALPPMVDMFTTLGADLPLPTRILMGVTQFSNTYRLQLGAGALIMLAGGIWFLRQPVGQRLLDRFKLKAPLVGPPTHMGEMARFCRTVSMLVASGLHLQEILELMPQTSTNSVIRNSLNRVREGLMLGQGLSGPMSVESVFPPLLVQMVVVGEESNSLEFTLGVVAEFYETTAEEKMAALVTFITPAATLLIAAATGFIALSVIMPMYSITGAF